MKTEEQWKKEFDELEKIMPKDFELEYTTVRFCYGITSEDLLYRKVNLCHRLGKDNPEFISIQAHKPKDLDVLINQLLKAKEYLKSNPNNPWK